MGVAQITFMLLHPNEVCYAKKSCRSLLIVFLRWNITPIDIVLLNGIDIYLLSYIIELCVELQPCDVWEKAQKNKITNPFEMHIYAYEFCFLFQSNVKTYKFPKEVVPFGWSKATDVVLLIHLRQRETWRSCRWIRVLFLWLEYF